MTDSDSSWFSLKRFAVALGTIALGTASGMTLVPMVGSYLGMLLGAFAAGLAFDDRPLLESGLAAVLAGGGVVLASKLVGSGIIGAIIGLVSMNPTILLAAAVIHFAVGAVGAHFGNDFRHGLTQPVDEDGGRLDGL